jgi:DNA-binding XRE family transcriptional regulator
VTSVYDDPLLTRHPCDHCAGRGYQIDDRILGAELKGRRIAADLSVAHLAEALDVSEPYVRDLENGRRHWSPALIAAYEQRLNGVGEG